MAVEKVVQCLLQPTISMFKPTIFSCLKTTLAIIVFTNNWFCTPNIKCSLHPIDIWEYVLACPIWLPTYTYFYHCHHSTFKNLFKLIHKGMLLVCGRRPKTLGMTWVVVVLSQKRDWNPGPQIDPPLWRPNNIWLIWIINKIYFAGRKPTARHFCQGRGSNHNLWRWPSGQGTADRICGRCWGLASLPLTPLRFS